MDSVRPNDKKVNVDSRLRKTHVVMRMLGFHLLDYESRYESSGTTRSDLFLRLLATASLLYIVIPAITAMTQFFHDLRHLSEVTSVVLSCTQSLSLIANLYLQESKYRQVVKKMREELWTESLTPILWDQFRIFDRFAAIITMYMIIVFYGVLSVYLTSPLWFHNFNLYKDLNAMRRIPFIAKFYYDERPSPQYEITYACQILGCFYAMTSDVGLVSLYAILSMHLCAKLRLLTVKFTEIDATTTAQDFTELVREHRFAKDVEDLHSPILLVHFLLSTILICLNVVKLTSVSVHQNRLEFSLFVMYFAGAFFEIFILCWIANKVFLESENLATAIYCSRWFEAAKPVQHGVLLTLMRAQSPSVLTAGKFFPISLESFGTVCTTAVSYYTLLKSVAPG
ncbi:odorant receptor 4-like isoform X2 [Athalia rosae]|uniref:odorant receptor 4-like isoform X2 n=1 Tax=Athalia rosae TaxID=37344 RepID=UPI00203332F0|nr:odorant receptor 4-like isoform X2 [Athalia rosae]